MLCGVWHSVFITRGGTTARRLPVNQIKSMLKYYILNYQASIKNSIKSSSFTAWVISLILIPVGLFFVLLLFEKRLADFIMDLYPPVASQGEFYYRDYIYIARIEILFLGFFFLLGFLLVAYASRRYLENTLNIASGTKAIYYMMLIASAFFMTTIFIKDSVLENFPNSSDEYAYLFQAEMFSRDKLWERAHDLPDFFYNNNIAQHDGILVSRFPPGWPLVLSLAFEIGMNPTFVNPVLGLITLLVFYFFARKYYGNTVAVWSAFAMSLTGFYLFNSASYFSHVSCLLVTILFVFSIHLYRDSNRITFALLAGFFLALVVVIRYYTAVLIFIPFLISWLVEYRWKALRLFLLMGIGSIPCIAYLLWYNYSITGNALVPVTMWAYPSEQIGFVKGHTFLKGVEHLIRRTLMFIYWTSPGLLILYAVYLVRKFKTPSERFMNPEDYSFLALTIGYFFYYQIGGNQYGPRFMFEAFPFVIVFVVSKVIHSRHKWARALLIVSLLFPIVKLPFIAFREAKIVDQRQDLYDLVKEQNVQNAVVFVSASTCPIRPMPASDLTRNDAMFMNDIIYVLEIPHINDQLVEVYQDRAFYKYIRDADNPRGELLRIR